MHTGLGEQVELVGSLQKSVEVQISYEVIKLFSEQLYASPLKAIEELVVNSWDAQASVCSVLVDLDSDRPVIAVFDDGMGMSLTQLEDLWHIGISHKPKSKTSRKLIGKFGIGKLASYAVARRATYISKTLEGLHAVSIDFQVFADATDANTGAAKKVSLSLRRIENIEQLKGSPAFASAIAVLDTKPKAIDLKATPTWTLVVLEDLKEKAHLLSKGKLRWVLQTAMPLESDFQLFLDGEQVESSKEKLKKVVHFRVDELDDLRLKDLGAATGETWTKIPGGVKSAGFPSGITGEAFVTEHSLYAEGGKSEDLGRSHGFFVRVHNRLINESDPLFGARPQSFSTFYRFAAIVEASDLNKFITAARDDIEQIDLKKKLRELLLQLFRQARERFEAIELQKTEQNKFKKEGFREYVSTELVERPLADALVAEASPFDGGVVEGWRLIEPIHDAEQLQKLVSELYSAERSDRRYSFQYSSMGRLAPIARLDPRSGVFTLNEDHQLVVEFSDNPNSKRLLESVVVGEALLEVYLHAAHVDSEVIIDLLERRDSLLRSLALDESYSLKSLARALRDATSSANDLEVAMVGALRALGFSAKHIGGAGTPDGLANYVVHGGAGDPSFTLEAKSSKDVPSLGHLDFAGLRSHYEANGAQGCLLVAPSYPGGNDLTSEVSLRAKQQHVSCWTIAQLASLVETAERRHINARNLQDIVLEAFAPMDVTDAITRLLSEPSFDKVDLYRGIIFALTELQPRLKSTPRNVSMIAAEISRDPKFESVEVSQIEQAIVDLARASSGMLHLSDTNEVFVIGDLDEFRRRVSRITGEIVPPRRIGTFRTPEL
jgi:hypothetical protein